MRKTAEILGVPLDSVTMQQAVDITLSFLKEDRNHAVYTPNSEIIMAAHRDEQLKNILKNSDMTVADGAGVILASKILKLGLPEKVSGIDLVRNLFKISPENNISYFFFGSKPGIAEAAGEKIRSTYGNIDIKGYRNGYFSEADEAEIVEQVNASGADVLLVALGAPKQEKWIDKHKSELKVKVCIGIGGSLDVFAGTVKLAPEFYRKHGLEWFYRLCKEPWRYKRMLDLPRFILRILAIKLHLKKNV